MLDSGVKSREIDAWRPISPDSSEDRFAEKASLALYGIKGIATESAFTV